MTRNKTLIGGDNNIVGFVSIPRTVNKEFVFEFLTFIFFQPVLCIPEVPKVHELHASLHPNKLKKQI
jgi:hypothetical protein